MTFWTILIITYGAGPLDGQVAYVPLPTRDACEAAMDLTFEALHQVQPDVMVQCFDTSTPTRIPRPMPRPANLGE